MSRNVFVSAAILIVFFAAPLLCPAQQTDAQSLLDAAKNGQISTIQSLLAKGVSPTTKDENGRTPLHLAAANGHQATADAILGAGADINATDNAGKTPLDLAEAGGHSGLTAFLLSKGAKRGESAVTPAPGAPVPDEGTARPLKPSLKFKTLAEFEKEIRQPAVLLDSANVCFFAPKQREREARLVFPYLVKAYDAFYRIVGTHTNYKMVVYAFPKGNPNGWGGTSECSIEYDDTGLDLASQQEWIQFKIPHVSGYIEEMAHNFVSATQAQFGWEMVGWSLGAEVTTKVAGNPIWAASLKSTRTGQEQTFAQYVRDGFVFPRNLPANQCDRLHAWIIYQAAAKYGPNFWPDFFREIRAQKQALADAVQLRDADKIRNARYQITISCFDRLPGLNFKKTLSANGISLTTDVKSLHPESPNWNRRLTE